MRTGRTTVRSIGAVSAVAPGLSEARIGEIDIVEGVNDQSPNQASFHTSSGASSSILLAITTADMSLVGVCRLHDACVARANRVSPKLPAYILPRSFLRPTQHRDGREQLRPVLKLSV